MQKPPDGSVQAVSKTAPELGLAGDKVRRYNLRAGTVRGDERKQTLR